MSQAQIFPVMQIRSLLSFLFVSLLFFAAAESCRAAQPPHVVFVFVDDFGWGDPASYGGKVPTPALDRLAREGTQFRQFYTASPICSPSRCGVITGQFPSRWRITSYLQTRAGNRECGQADYLDAAAPSLPRLFSKAGYATAHIGKWHLGGGRDVTDAPPFSAYGYDLGLGTYESPEPAAPLGLKSTPWALEREPQQVPRHERTRWMVDQTLAFFKTHRQDKKPCFINLWLDDTHTPFRPTEAKDEREVAAKFRDVLTETDRQIGRLLAGLEEMGLAQDTLLILAGDNGPEPSLERSRTGGLRGMKWSLYEGGIRTPLMVRWPGHVPAGLTNDQTVICAIDLVPTLAALSGLPLPANYASDGEDLSAAFLGKSPLRQKPLFWEYGRSRQAKPMPSGGKGKIRLFPYPQEPDSRSPNLAMRQAQWKLLMNSDESQVELYDLDRDPKETQNLAGKHPETAAQMQQALRQWKASLPGPKE